jgi:hypothetical protein
MKLKLIAEVFLNGKSDPLIHEFEYSGDTREECIHQIDTLPYHQNNLDKYGKTSFKSTDGVMHKWVIEVMN